MASRKLKKQFVKLLHDHQGIVHQICRMYYPNPDDREDAFQEVVLQLWKAFPSFRQEAQFTTWMYRVALNTILKNIRQQTSQLATKQLDEIPDQSYNTPGQEAKDVIEAALLQLDSIDKALMILHLEGYNYDEIAQIMSLTKTNVATKIGRIKQKIRKIITQEQYAAQ